VTFEATTPAPTTVQPPAVTDARRAILFMLAGVSMFPFVNAAAKYLMQHYPLPEVIWARFAGHIVLVLLIFAPRLGLRCLFHTRRPTLQFARSGLMAGSTLLFIAGLQTLPLATASSIVFTSPLIVTALSVPLLGEAVGWRRWTAVGVGFVGALIIIRPGLGVVDWAPFLILGSATCYALYQIFTRKIGTIDRAETTIAYAALFGALALSAIAPFVWKAPDSWPHVALFVALGAFGGIGHFFVIKGFQLYRAAVLAPLIYAELIGASILGYLIFGSFPDALTWLGALVIIASGVYTFNREAVRQPRRGRRAEMARSAERFVCQDCGAVHPKRSGKCAACGAWSTIVDEPAEPLVSRGLSAGKGKPIAFSGLDDPEFADPPRLSAGIAELDRVTGGGLPTRSVHRISL
jgi:drug/metabolite transporter (DMT)-like permease